MTPCLEREELSTHEKESMSSLRYCHMGAPRMHGAEGAKCAEILLPTQVPTPRARDWHHQPVPIPWSLQMQGGVE